jgi:cell division topological specificity factor
MMFFGWGKKSKDKVKDRLAVVLAYDRAQIPPGKVDALRDELVLVIRKYFPSEKTDVKLEVEQRGETVILTADIPIK